MRCPRLGSLLFVFAATSLCAQEPLPPPPVPLAADEFRARRETVVKQLAAANPGERLVVLVRGASKAADMGPFVQDQDFTWLCGIAEPDLAIVLVPGPNGELQHDELLVPPFTRFAATWDGKFLAPGEEAARRTGFAKVGNVRSLRGQLATLLEQDSAGKRATLVTLVGAAARTGSTPRKAGEAAEARKKDPLDGRGSREDALIAALKKEHDGLDVKGLDDTIHGLRHVKSPGEIAMLRRCSEIAAAGLAEAMRSCEVGHYEFQLAAAARFVFTLRGAGPDAYAAIVGGGPNGCILHYNTCERQLVASDLIVMDYAPTLHGYATDVTRTFPASGKFTSEQRKLVQDVWEIQQALIADVKPGASLRKISEKCAAMLIERGYRNDHGPCHHVGLAVHDPHADVLAPGMVITVEPGAYLRDIGMGCRIEDTILVTPTGCEVLSKDVPSTPDAIEALMAKGGLLPPPAASAPKTQTR
jgi:Xaa-Pro aminopeptidase